VGHCLDIYAEFSGTGGQYEAFPTPRKRRVHIKDLHDPEIRERFRKIWHNPHSLDPSKHATALPLRPDQITYLLHAANQDWSAVEPAIFGTLLERALDPRERHKLGAHYTPVSYVEPIVRRTVIDPLRAEWESVKIAAAQLDDQGKTKDARAAVETFHHKLANIRVLDPACGSGNFLYVALELLKRLVTLNHTRAEEEKRGLIRWLRPDYQNPGSTPTPEQKEIDLGPEDFSLNTENLKLETLAWPTALSAQVSAIQKLLPTTGPYAAALAGHFGKPTKARIQQVTEILKTLEGLGRL
jgi:hypothetical protein